MKSILFSVGCALFAAFLVGCQTLPPGAEPGPSGTMAFDVLVEASEPGARIEANGEDVGATPVHLKIFGDPDGTFHDFGSSYYVIRALPLATNQFEQIMYFETGHLFGPEQRVPRQINFNMNTQTPLYPPSGPPPNYYGPPPYPYYYYGPPYFYGPPYYYWGPSYHYYGGPHHDYHRDIHPR